MQNLRTIKAFHYVELIAGSGWMDGNVLKHSCPTAEKDGKLLKNTFQKNITIGHMLNFTMI